MRDIHCHILPGVDDGARDLDESLAMLEAAKAAGITSIVCTPHCRDPYYDAEAMKNAFDLLVKHANGFPLQMAFEVHVAKLHELGINSVASLAFEDTDEFLLEFDTLADIVDFREYQRLIYRIQAQGYRVIIAHPERYAVIKDNPRLARDLTDMGCQLQASADFVASGLFGLGNPTAKRLMKDRLYSHIASDAHCVDDYLLFKKAHEKYGAQLR